MREAVEPPEFEAGNIVMNRVISRLGKIEVTGETLPTDLVRIRYADDWDEVTPCRFLRHATDAEVIQYNERKRTRRIGRLQ